MNLSSAGKALEERAAYLFLHNLKQNTSALHVQLETQPSMAALMSAEVSREDYYHYLACMYHIQLEYERKVLPRLTFLFPNAETRKASFLIEKDINDIGFFVDDNIIIKSYHLPVEILTTSFSLGVMYVLEGSKLGGKVIFKHLSKRLGISSESGARFITDNGGNTANSWKQFLVIFSQYLVGNQGEKEAIAGASYAFESIYQYYQSNARSYAH
jgi:heme oxygenase